MAGPERAATVAALMSLIRSTSESPAGDGGVLFLAIGSDATPRPSLPPFHTDGRCLKALCGFRGLRSFRRRRGRAQPLAGIARRDLLTIPYPTPPYETNAACWRGCCAVPNAHFVVNGAAHLGVESARAQPDHWQS